MAQKPIFVATHPRACSTAFERVCPDFVLDGLYSTDAKRQVFMTRRDALNCIHEPFGDAFYYGPERLSKRFEDDEEGRKRGGFSHSTYQTIVDRFEKEGAEVRSTPFPVPMWSRLLYLLICLRFPCHTDSVVSMFHLFCL